MTNAEELAHFAVGVRYQDLSEETRRQFKIRIMDSLGCAVGALDGSPPRMIRSAAQDQGKMGGRCTLIGGGNAPPDVAAFYNGALVRYLDFNDSFLAKGETCHPSDNLGALLAAVEFMEGTSRDLITALAIAYEVQCALSEAAPVRGKGFDHTVQGAYALAAGLSKALHLTESQTANAIALCGTALNALRVTRTGALSHWKGMAYPFTACSCMQLVFLAKNGMTGPLEVFEGVKGFMDSIAGPFAIDWTARPLEIVHRTILKKYNAEIHSQSAIEGILELMKEQLITAEQIERVTVEIFDVAYHIIGGGEEGDKTAVHSKEEADHSLPYVLSAAILDGQVMPEQYEPERILRKDIQEMMSKIKIIPSSQFGSEFPEKMRCRLTVRLKDGQEATKDQEDYEGFHTLPMTHGEAIKKFRRLCEPYIDSDLEIEILDWLSREDALVSDLMRPLSRIDVLSPV